MKTQKPRWEAETCALGGHLCGHAHRSRKAAERCLPKIPKNPSSSLTQNFSLANVYPINEEAEIEDRMHEDD